MQRPGPSVTPHSSGSFGQYLRGRRLICPSLSSRPIGPPVSERGVCGLYVNWGPPGVSVPFSVGDGISSGRVKVGVSTSPGV